jgi:hypothetical protein
MSNTEIGELLNGTEGRDAIHIAIAPVVAGEYLEPGSYITFRENAEEGIVVQCSPALAIGIVDPFLKKDVRQGDRFYMFLNPNTITSLRHEWTHPAFSGMPSVVDTSKSEAWLRDFCNNHDAPDFEALIGALKGGGEYDAGDGYRSISMDGDYIYVSGMDAHGDIPDDFWVHAEIIAGRKFTNRPSRFSCSC